MFDTYVAALQHDLVDLPADTTLVGVVRRPTGWFQSTVDENHPALGPPPDLLDEVQRRREDLAQRGVCDEEAHNAAWTEASFDRRYRDHIDESAEARAAVADLLERLRSGERLALVCFENTEKKRCHRTLLRERLAEHLRADE
nr:DUF488 family protein [Halomarina rubra]